MSSASKYNARERKGVQFGACAQEGMRTNDAADWLNAPDEGAGTGAGNASATAATLLARLKSQRGASFAMALFLIIVCIAISSIVLAAATASAGWMADRGEMDQRYYSVTSAARLFQGSIGKDDECTFTFVQTKTGTRPEGGGEQAIEWDNVPGESEGDGEGDGDKSVNIKITTANRDNVEIGSADDKGFNFLTDITRLALFKQMVKAEDTLLESPDPDSGWVEPIIDLSSSSITGHYVEISYTVAPSVDDDENDQESALRKNAADLTTYVTARLWGDWVLELDFSSSDPKASSNNQVSNDYHLYMALAADVSTEASRQEELVDAGDSVVNNVTDMRTTQVKWRLQRIVPGRGMAATVE